MTVALPDIIGRDEARALGLKRFFTGKPCKHRHVAERIVSSHRCTECDRASALKWRTANLEKARERDRARARKHRAADPEKAREYLRVWRAANKDKISKRQAAQQRAGRAGSELNGAGLTGL
jgi:hypothetical protein